MIENDKQYQVTKDRLKDFIESIEFLEKRDDINSFI